VVLKSTKSDADSANDLDKTFKRMQIEDVRREDIIELATFLDRDQDGLITRCERYEIVSGA
jgi:hypothetical protein